MKTAAGRSGSAVTTNTIASRDAIQPWFIATEPFQPALEVKARLHQMHPHEPHSECHVWAIFRANDQEGGGS
jgi:hypothetical protein